MKLYEVLAGQDVPFSAVIKLVYKLALTSINLSQDLKTEASYLMRETDELWVYEMDEAHDTFKAVTRDGKVEPREFEDVIEAIQRAVEAVAHKTIEYYSNSWNHPPGYRPPKAKMDLYSLHSKEKNLHKEKEFDRSKLKPRYEPVSEKLIKSEIEKLLPGFGKAQVEIVKSYQREQKQRWSEYLKKVGEKFKDEEKIKKVADFILQHEDASWKDFEKSMNDEIKSWPGRERFKDKTAEEKLWHLESKYLPKEIKTVDVLVKTENSWKSKPAKELRAVFKEKSKYFFSEVIENILSFGKIENDEAKQLHDDMLEIKRLKGAPLKKLERMYFLKRA